MMYYHGNDLWYLVDDIRDTLFNQLQNSYPEKFVKIRNVENKSKTKSVRIKELESYSRVRNLNALRRGTQQQKTLSIYLY